jgi:hypothetical protein
MRDLKSRVPITNTSTAIRARFRDGPPAFRKAYVQNFIDDVGVGDQEIRITGPKAALLDQVNSVAEMPVPVVRTFEQGWCPHHRQFSFHDPKTTII